MTVDLLFSDVFRKFPKLQFAISEGGIGWIPYLKERADYTWERQKFWSGLSDSLRPSEVFDQHIWGCFIDDETGIAQREAAGVDHLMIEVDFPHSDSPWPHTQKRVAEMLRDVPDDEAHKIAELNARRLYNFPA
jgi:predicted TIM-barrel fold metal-dependent hydrolase